MTSASSPVPSSTAYLDRTAQLRWLAQALRAALRQAEADDAAVGAAGAALDAALRGGGDGVRQLADLEAAVAAHEAGEAALRDLAPVLARMLGDLT